MVSGDYKVEDDGISGKFEPVKCNTFITESTFGLPIYKWKPQEEIYDNIITWINKNKENGKNKYDYLPTAWARPSVYYRLLKKQPKPFSPTAPFLICNKC